ncbi:uncharacterized protein FOBCDRAFT_321020 [Fusarium oxysporum Fo47]|uniref:WSC domain-containing protein n=3 Tax=Fusarium oxysporum TaxID=5507 RepID=A0A2H3GXW2_FUSOX|nr:uncharacterized protein FOBCDRAFT_321020 [Fusarium oxysporum Fo47]PCD32698.1 hypothetical protein AU210_008941 [Fusarium oxysporum f. sp. radicis-cucumerinum]RKK15653.1 hypothetical protein BFJ65_g9240 [Fusarium oxysporum f. sp. cepae]EWZ40559.1 hypothetical protein FOZG_09221 [Fusarium oxysporum Fo47]QKD56424.1 hypothetical protein FOBCDRAFT_321020 [Fusarium oxysporum Fo47]RKK54448.1 hypothetical protein BFJ66_g4651 [Fusarium oxysporum f. sp. cepae]
MRLSSSLGLLLACASGALGQVQQLHHFKRFTNSSTSAIETQTPTSSIETATSVEATTTSASPSALATIALNLKDFTLGPGASFYPPPDGDSILLRPVPRDGSSLEDGSSLDRRQIINPRPFTPPNISITFVRFTLPPTVIYGPVYLTCSNTLPCFGYSECAALVFGNSKRDLLHKRDVPCVFQVLVDDEIVSQEPITGTGTLNLATNPFALKPDYKFTFQQQCGSVLIPVILQGVALIEAPGKTSTPIPTVAVAPGTATTESSVETTGVVVTTNSDGETVILTEATGTASSGAAGFTTNSEGETVSLTETAATNSEGETVFPTTTTGAASSSTATSVPGFPGSILDFTLFGCVGSIAGFPTFTSVETSERMDLDVCGGLCAGRAYFGVYDTTCYCGDELGDDASRVNLGECDIECPGDDSQFCGGDSSARRLRARQNVPSNRLLTVYAAPQDVVVTDSVTQTVTEEQTIVTTLTTTVTGASTTAVEAITTTLVCVNGQCFPSASTVYIFVELNGSDCDGQWVFISVPYPGGHKYVPQFCSGGNCASLQVYKPQQCDDWYNYDSFFVASDCTACSQGIQYLPWQNSWGTPDRCNDQVPACTGHSCPSKHQGVAPHGGNWSSNSTVPHGGSNGGFNGGSGGSSSGSSSNPNGGSNAGSNAGSNGGSGGSGSSSNPSANGGSSSGSNAAPGSEGTYPSTITVSSASKQAMNVLVLLSLFMAFL